MRNKEQKAKSAREWRARNHDRINNDEAYRKKDNARTALWRRNNPEKTKSILLKSEYGLSADNLDTLTKRQKNRCAICLKAIKLTVDHDHTTRVVRGLLCGNCNRGLGCFLDNPTFLRNAALYLESIHTQLPQL